MDLIKYFDRFYRSSPDFRAVATTLEFIDSLAGVLFPPISFSGGGPSESEGGSEKDGDNEWVRSGCSHVNVPSIFNIRIFLLLDWIGIHVR